MTARPLNRSWTTTFAQRVVLFLTATVSSLAVALAVPTIGGTSEGASKVPYRGTGVSYGATTTVYNYTPEMVAVGHRLGEMQVLLAQQHAEPLALQGMDGSRHLLDDDRRQAF